MALRPETGAVKEIALPLPPGLAPNSGRPVEAEKTPSVTPIDVPDLAELKVDSSSLAPDGYTFRSGADSYGGNVFDGLFYGSSRYRVQAELVKDGAASGCPTPTAPTTATRSASSAGCCRDLAPAADRAGRPRRRLVGLAAGRGAVRHPRDP